MGTCAWPPLQSGQSLPGVPLGALAATRGLLLGTDIMDTWPRPYDVDAPYAAIATRQFRWAIETVRFQVFRLSTDTAVMSELCHCLGIMHWSSVVLSGAMDRMTRPRLNGVPF